MKKKYAIYCSGSAGRVFHFYNEFDFSKFPVEFLFYDGQLKDITNRLNLIFENKLIEYTSKENPSNELLRNLVINKVDYLFCFGQRILKGDLLRFYKNKIINFHPSLLPAFKGINAIDQALASSVQLLGNTAHFIDQGIDSGPIIMQSVISRQSYSSYEDVLSLQIEMLEKIWNLLDADKIKVNNNFVEIISTKEQTQHFFSI